MTTQALPISRLVNVQVNLTPQAAQPQDIATLLVLGSSGVIDTTERVRTYFGIDAVAQDFGTTAPEYKAAALWFEQAPKPAKIQIGAWAKTGSNSKLVCAPITASVANFVPINNGAFVITIDGVQSTISGLDFSAVTSMNGVASVIEAALNFPYPGSTCVWNSVYSRFEITSGSTGSASGVSFLGISGVGTDIGGLLGGLSTSSGAYLAQGVSPETAVACVALFDNSFGQSWYAITVLGATDNDHLDCAAYIEAATTKHLYGVSTQEAGILSAGSTTDIASLLKDYGYRRAVVQYSSSTAYAVCSLLGRILTTNYNANSSVITLMYKQEPGVVPETLTATQVQALEAKNCNVFVAYNNNTAIIENGVVSSGDFLDIITGTDWLALSIQTAVFNLLYTSSTKIPQTDAGTQLIVTTTESVCAQAVANGLLAPGLWNASGFGALAQGDFLAKGFYVYAPPVASQFQADREARKSVPIQVAAKLAGAIHTVDIIINVNR